jgi:CheY-like chemotaxis protein
MKTNLQKRTTILWADDDPDELIKQEMLHRLGSQYRIIHAKDGQKALQYLEQAKQNNVLPCLIILDLNMPVLNGKETLQQLKENCTLKEIPTVIFTTSCSTSDKEFCDRYETEMFTKPFTLAALREVVQKLLQLCTVSIKEP